MLIQFRVANYRSFGSEVTLSLEAVKAFKEHEENVFEANDYRLLRSAVIYGANASGKSNLVQAISFMRHVVLESANKNSVAEIPTDPFRLDKKYLTAPSLFEVTFILESLTYRYGFEVTKSMVCSEWLFRSTGSRNKEFRLFAREFDEIDVADEYVEGRGREADTRNNALFLSTIDQKNGAVAHKIVKWFNDFAVLSGVFDEFYQEYTLKQLEDSTTRERIVDFVRQVDGTILDIVSRKIRFPEEMLNSIPSDMAKKLRDEKRSVLALTRVQTEDGKPCGEIEFDLDDDESAGTGKILRLAGPWLNVLDKGRIAFVDELEAKLHPHLTRRLVRLFNSPKTNPKNAQLVFVTHDTNLLTYGGLRRDQVWFCEKNRKGATDLYSLAEIKVRKGARFENDYIAGKYGAIPYFGNVTKIGGEVK